MYVCLDNKKRRKNTEISAEVRLQCTCDSEYKHTHSRGCKWHMNTRHTHLLQKYLHTTRARAHTNTHTCTYASVCAHTPTHRHTDRQTHTHIHSLTHKHTLAHTRSRMQIIISSRPDRHACLAHEHILQVTARCGMP